MAGIRLEIRSRRPYADGQTFGEIGPYERFDGTLQFAVDPGDAANRAIVDLDKAARDAEGRVRFWADFCLLQPANPLRGSRRLLFEVPNRGRKLVPRHFNRTDPQPVPTEAIDPGDGFLMRHGWTIAWCSWQWDVVRNAALMGLEAPTALEGGRPIEGQVAVEFQPNEPMLEKLLANRVHQPYPAADVDDSEAVLTVRDWPDGPRTTIPREQWRFATTKPAPSSSDSHVQLAGGFEPGKVYEVVYRTRICPVVGTGLLAVRDCVAFLRHGAVTDGNPCAGWAERTYGFGMSQSGRFLRHFLHLGLNLDEAGRQVFDGVIPHVAGARRGEFNQRFGQPSVQSTPGFGHLMPFTADDQADPLTERTDGLLRRQRALGGVPKIFMTNSSAEYWRGDCSLIHTDLAGKRDVEPPPEERIYHFAGTQHGLGVVPLIDFNEGDGCRGANPFNAVDYSPLLRAALVNLDRWVTEGVEPPPSAFPRLADGSAVPAADVLEVYRRVPGAHVPDPDRLPMMRRVDLGPESERGVGSDPAEQGEPYRTYVSAVDADGNEVAGIRLPDLTVPLATYTGWNPRHPETSGPGQIIPMQGSTFPFARSSTDGKHEGDPRPAVDVRYPTASRYRRDPEGGQVRYGHEVYPDRIAAAAEELVAQRYLLAEDVTFVVQLAGERFKRSQGFGGW